MHNKPLKHRAFGAGQFLSRSFVVLLRKSIPQNHNLKTAAELGYMNSPVRQAKTVFDFQIRTAPLHSVYLANLFDYLPEPR
jgi:hypothetical protein